MAVRTSREAANRAETTARREAIARRKVADIAAVVAAEAATTVEEAEVAHVVVAVVAVRIAAEDTAAIGNQRKRNAGPDHDRGRFV